MTDSEYKQQVRQFYDQVGWQMVGEGVYQNTRYEDLRPVSQEYIHRCHLRVNHFLKEKGGYLLDAGSGPIQYPEYLTYSQGYRRRVCLDISIVALLEARRRIADHGLYVVADVATLPFKAEVFEGVVSLHTLHHLSYEDQKKAYFELYRVLMSGCSAIVVNGWTNSPLMNSSIWLVRLLEKLNAWVEMLRTGRKPEPAPLQKKTAAETGAGTFIRRMNSTDLRRELSGKIPFEIRVWRSVNIRFLRALIHPRLGGRYWLKLLYGLEERFPHFFGEKGQYPLIVVHKESAER